MIALMLDWSSVVIGVAGFWRFKKVRVGMSWTTCSMDVRPLSKTRALGKADTE